MKLQELYLNDINRKVNPAVSASDLDPETVKVEIEEYVFSLEILKNLYKVLSNIKNNTTSHNGIWISGYYGSGKSHFLKYLDFCMSPTYREKALECFATHANEYNSMEHDVDWMPNDIRDLTKWFAYKANIDTIMFNIGSSYNAGSERTRIFTEVLWGEFNAMRGYNKSHIALAQYLEKFLDKQGKFEEFKQRLLNEYGLDWSKDASNIAIMELDVPLMLAQEIVPTFSVDAARKAIIDRTVDLSVNNFADELAEYIEQKNDPNYRLVFFIDEVSQFINGDGRLLLQLQSVVKEIHDKCKDRVWVACTAQQDLREILDDCQINASSTEFGKILGRFEVQASLSGTKSEYIAQKRILAKKDLAQTELSRFYEKNASAIDTQFQLPSTYEGYRDKDTFIDYYPFVPYQLQLINNVFSEFVALNYVNKEVKGNERSVIRITHNIAKTNGQAEMGTFISFDQFFNDMFRSSLQPAGNSARRRADEAAAQYDRDKDFAQRVVNVLFMICNMGDSDKQQFPATIDNVVTLLLRDIDTPKTTMKDDVQRVIEHLIDNSVIRENKLPHGATVYEFFTEEESKIEDKIKNMQVDGNSQAEAMGKIFSAYFEPNNKENIGGSSVNIGLSVSGKRIFGGTSTDIEVEFVVSSPETDPNRYSFSNPSNKLVFFLTPLYAEDRRLRNQFIKYCKVDKFLRDPNLSAEQRKIAQVFADREKIIMNNEIVKRFNEMLDTCDVISGTHLLTTANIGDVKGKARYKAAMEAHLKSVFSMAHLVEGKQYAQTSQDLRARMLRRLDSNEYLLKPMTDAEEMVQNYILMQGHDVTVADITAAFAKPPYGWSEIVTIDIINELYRRNIFAYSYNNNPNVRITEVVEKIIREKNRFTLEKAQIVSPEVITAFNDAWRAIFNRQQTPTNDARELFRLCHDDNNSELRKLHDNYETIRRNIAKYPFVAKIDEALDLMNEWLNLREQTDFFNAVIAKRNEAKDLFDRCKEIVEFYRNQLEKYRDILSFINANATNFELLGDEAKADIDGLKAIIEDAEVFKNFKDYVRYKNSVRARIEQKKQELVANVRTAYEQVYDQVRNLAASSGVPTTFLPDIENKMLLAKNESSLYRLRDMTDTSDFLNTMLKKVDEEVAKLQQQQQQQQQQGGGQQGGSQQQHKPAKKTRLIKLDTKIVEPLKNEHDVDVYLARLRQQLMERINNNEQIIIQ